MKKLLSVIVSLCLVLSGVSVAVSAKSESVSEGRDTTLIVEFEKNALLESSAAQDMGSGKYQKTAGADRALDSIETAQQVCVDEIESITGGEVEIEYRYTHVLNGVAFEGNTADIEKIKALPGIKNVYESYELQLITDGGGSSRMGNTADTVGLNEVYAKGYKGEGMAVAVIDGGIYEQHDAFRLSDDSTAKYTKDEIAQVIKSNELNAGDVDVDSVYKNAKIPYAFDYGQNNTDVFDDADDGVYHGTHVSGIVAGNNDKITGVAPEAQVLMFKVDVFDNTVFLESLLAALDDAVKFDISAINMSVGLDYKMPNNPEYEPIENAILAARNAGILVATAAGNSARATVIGGRTIENTDYSVSGIPATLSGSTTVASSDNNKINYFFGEELTLSNGETVQITEYMVNTMDEVLPEYEYVDVELESRTGVGKYQLEGKVALLSYSSTSGRLPEKDLTALLKWLFSESGAVAVVYDEFYSDLILYFLMADEMEFELISACSVSREAMETMKSLEDKRILFPKPEDMIEKMSYYSSWGVTDSLELAINITAPGGNIISSVADGDYDVYSGTSMASPHIAGAGALLEQYINDGFPDITGREKADLKENLIMSTASIVRDENGVAFSPRLQGAGMLNMAQATDTNAVLKNDDGVTLVNLYEIPDNTFTFSFFAQNLTDAPVTYDTLNVEVMTDDYCEAEPSYEGETGDLGYVLASNMKPLDFTFTSDAQNGITLAANETREITVTVELDAQLIEQNLEVFTNGFYIDGYVTLSDSTAQNTQLNIPFMGYRGDWTAAPALFDDKPYYYFNEYDSLLYIEVAMLRGARKLSAELIDKDGKSVSSSQEQQYVCKMSYATLTFENFDKSMLPDGEYILRCKIEIDIGDGDERAQMMDFKLVVDETPPEVAIEELKDVYGIKYLRITSNEPLSVIYISGRRLHNILYTTEVWYPISVSESESQYVYEIDVEYSLSMLEVECWDEYYNRTVINRKSRIVEWFLTLYYNITSVFYNIYYFLYSLFHGYYFN